jgi:hypothetical protein
MVRRFTGIGEKIMPAVLDYLLKRLKPHNRTWMWRYAYLIALFFKHFLIEAYQ